MKIIQEDVASVRPGPPPAPHQMIRLEEGGWFDRSQQHTHTHIHPHAHKQTPPPHKQKHAFTWTHTNTHTTHILIQPQVRLCARTHTRTPVGGTKMSRMPFHSSPPPGSCRSRGLRGPGRHAVPAGAQRVPPHRPREVHLPPPAPSLGPDTAGLMAGIFYSLSARRSSRLVVGEGLPCSVGSLLFSEGVRHQLSTPLFMYAHLLFSRREYTSG